jgi:hypothetical protein
MDHYDNDNFPFRIDYCLYWKSSEKDNNNDSEWIVYETSGYGVSTEKKLLIKEGTYARNHAMLDWAEQINGTPLYEYSVGY